jgi:hypothetical protein
MANLPIWCNYVVSIGRGVDQMGTMSKKHDRGNSQKKTKKDVYHYANVPEVLFQKWFPVEGAKP